MNGELERLQSSMMAALFDAEALPEALTHLGNHVGAPIALLWAVSFNDEILQTCYTGPVNLQALERSAEFMSVNPRVRALPQMAVGQVTRDGDFITQEDVRRDPCYQDLLIPGGVGHMASVPMDTSRDRYFGLAVHRPITEAAFSDEEAARFREAAKACASVFNMMPLIEARTARTALQTIGGSVAAAILRRDGTLIDHNESFEALVARGLAKKTQAGRLEFKNRIADAALGSALNQADGLIGGRFLLIDLVQREKLICSLAPAPPVGHLVEGDAAAILTIQPLDQPAVLDRHLAASVFGLTLAECDVAARLMTGADIKSIARDRGVVEATVRTILKSVMSKTETHSQAEIVARLHRFIN